MPGLRLTYQERCEISFRLRYGVSLRSVAAALGRPCSTVAREVARNGGAKGYRASLAEHRWNVTKRRPKPFRLETNRRLARRVELLLLQSWSPEQISARLRRDHPHDPHWWVSAEAIYHSVYVQTRGGLRAELSRYLRRQRVRRKRRTGQGRTPDMIMIAERPPEAKDRAIPGHWEGDLIMGYANHSQVGILTERTTRYTILFPLADKRAETVNKALVNVVRGLPSHLVRSLTWDQGKELSQHLRFTVDTGVQSISATRDIRGSVGPPRTPLAWFASTCPRGLPWMTLTRPLSAPSRKNSTSARARLSAGTVPQRRMLASSRRNDRQCPP